ncbi:hypothetical protein MS3_00011097 [Schistosoma haematobium]|uniref:Egg protein CP391S-like protein n=1 Tax=Schistosoma haematobium TaxID=6185 RepID=A0A922IIF0_SCHHA|nr:hypothetical protein MS3_00011097 [Schistosoma haematobium]KAH9580211.1 hypothetical protein MS3_00011097 [Schistosoma haematobium]
MVTRVQTHSLWIFIIHLCKNRNIFIFIISGELLAVRKSYYQKADDKIPAFSITTAIIWNGNIIFHYENVPTIIGESQKLSIIAANIDCGADEEENVIYVPGKWIQSGTLMEFEALGDCPKHVSSEACHGATIPDTTCIWCETANMCITSNDKDLHEFKVNGCKNKSSTVNVATEPTTLATTETDLKKTSGSIESHLNMTTDTTTPATTETDLRNELKKTSPSTESHLNMTTYTAEHMEETKTLQYVYIVVPLVISFLIVCIGCSIWLWFYRRNRVHP